MAIPIIPTIALTSLLALALYRYIIFPIFLSPLSSVPAAHWSASFSPLWILNLRRLEQSTPATHAAHGRLGPIIRVAPNELSINSVDGGIRTIYAGGYPKGNWYRNVFNNYSIMPMFSMPDHASHSKRKRMLSNIYAKSTLQASRGMTAITETLLNDSLIPKLRETAKKGEPVECYDLFCAMAMDFVSSYVFGLKNASHFIELPDSGAKFFRDYKARQRYQFWPQEVPRFTAWMGKLGLRSFVVPSWVDTANADIETWLISMCDKAEKTVRQAEEDGEKGNAADWPNVYSQLRNALLKESQSKQADLPPSDIIANNRFSVASEMLDHTLAGFDTSSITLTFLAWELSRPENVVWQEKLHAELATLNGNHDAKAIDALPSLHAILMETLRLHAAIPGNQPRVTPASATLGATTDGRGSIYSDLPANTRVQAQAWSLHRNPNIFPDPETWDPARWLESDEEQLREMQRWFWAFGSGGRMCVGSNLAVLDMKAIVSAVWGSFRTKCVEGRGMVHNGGYVAEPMGYKGKYCVLEIQEWEEK